MKQKVLAHKKALVLQSIWQLESYTDTPAIKKGKSGHNTAAHPPDEAPSVKRGATAFWWVPAAAPCVPPAQEKITSHAGSPT